MTGVEMAVLVLPLADDQGTLERVGGKGASLARLVRAGLPVPRGFHITTDAYRRFVAVNDLQAAIVAIAGEADSAQPETLEQAAARIQGLFQRGALPATMSSRLFSAAIRRWATTWRLPCARRRRRRTCPACRLPGSKSPISTCAAQRPCWTPSGAAGPRSGRREPSATVLAMPSRLAT